MVLGRVAFGVEDCDPLIAVLRGHSRAVLYLTLPYLEMAQECWRRPHTNRLGNRETNFDLQES